MATQRDQRHLAACIALLEERRKAGVRVGCVREIWHMTLSEMLEEARRLRAGERKPDGLFDVEHKP